MLCESINLGKNNEKEAKKKRIANWESIAGYKRFIFELSFFISIWISFGICILIIEINDFSNTQLISFYTIIILILIWTIICIRGWIMTHNSVQKQFRIQQPYNWKILRTHLKQHLQQENYQRENDILFMIYRLSYSFDLYREKNNRKAFMVIMWQYRYINHVIIMISYQAKNIQYRIDSLFEKLGEH